MLYLILDINKLLIILYIYYIIKIKIIELPYYKLYFIFKNYNKKQK